MTPDPSLELVRTMADRPDGANVKPDHGPSALHRRAAVSGQHVCRGQAECECRTVGLRRGAGMCGA